MVRKNKNIKSALILCVSIFALALALAQSVEAATTKISLYSYKCRICSKEFLAFKGTDLGSSAVNMTSSNQRGGEEQLKNVHPLSNKDKFIDYCTMMPYHDFVGTRGSESSLTLEEIYKKRDKIAVIKDGGIVSGVSLRTWKCFICGLTICTLNDDPNIRDWEQQDRYIFNLKDSSKMKKCNPKYFGHVFKEKRAESVDSMEICENLGKIYFVKPQ